MLTAALATTATVLTVVRAWPQVSRIAIHHDTTGVSASTWTLMLMAHVLWIAWSVGLGVVAVAIANVLAALGCVAVLVTMARHCAFRATPALMGATAVGLGGVGLMASGAASLLAAATTAITALMVLPQVVKAFREETKGISAATWWMAIASSITWSTYYVLIGQFAMILPNVVIFPSAIAILAKVYAARRPKRTTSQRRALSANRAVGTS